MEMISSRVAFKILAEAFEASNKVNDGNDITM